MTMLGRMGGGMSAGMPAMLPVGALTDEQLFDASGTARWDWLDLLAMTAGDGGSVVQGDSDTLATVPNATDPGNFDLTQTTPADRAVYDTGAVLDGSTDHMDMAVSSALPSNCGLTVIYKGIDTSACWFSDPDGTSNNDCAPLVQHNAAVAIDYSDFVDQMWIDGVDRSTWQRLDLKTNVPDDAWHVATFRGDFSSIGSTLRFGRRMNNGLDDFPTAGRLMATHLYPYTNDLRILAESLAAAQHGNLPT
jgi:hypothetical protein